MDLLSMKTSTESLRQKDRQPWLLKFQYHSYLLQFIKQMSHFNYFVVPTVSFPSFYYYTIPSNTSIDQPLPQTRTQISSEEVLRPTISTSPQLELSREELLAAGYEKKKKVWSAEQDQQLLELVNNQGISWKDIPEYMPGRTEKMCYSRYRRLLAEARQRWAPDQERRLKSLVEEKGQIWKEFTSQFPNRTWKQLRDKYTNYLRPNINKDDWSLEEDQKILELIGKYGTKWKTIQQEMENRTDNQIKNRYYGRLKILLKKKARRRTRN